MSLPVAPARPHVVRADIDVSDFSPTTITFIGRVGELYASRTFSEIMTRLSAISQGMTEADLKAVMDEVREFADELNAVIVGSAGRAA